MASPSFGPKDSARVPLQVLAALALACALGALLAIAVAAISPFSAGLVWAALFTAGAVIALLLLVLGLLLDPFRRRVLRRLEELEDRILAVEAARPRAPEAAPAIAQAPPPEPREPAPAAVVTPPPPEPPVPEPLPVPDSPRPAPPPPAVPAPPAQAPQGGNLELALGTRWLGRIGAVVLLVAVALFLKLGWDQGWLRPTPPARVLLGVALGAALLVGGDMARRRRPYGALAQALGGAGLGTVVLSLWAAVRLYHLLSPVAGLYLLALAATVVTAYGTLTRQRVLVSLAMATAFLSPHLVPAPAGGDLFHLCLAALFCAGGLVVAVGLQWVELAWLAAAGALVDLLPVLGRTPPTSTVRLEHAGGLLVVAVIFLLAAASSVRRRQDHAMMTSAVLAAALTSSWTLVAGVTRLDPLGSAHQAVFASAFLVAAATARWLAGREGAAVEGILAGGFAVAALLPGILLPMILFGRTMVGLGWAIPALALGWWGLSRGRPLWQRSAAVFAALAWLPSVTATHLDQPWPAAVTLLTAAFLFLLVHLASRAPGSGGMVDPWLGHLAGPAAALAALGWARVTATVVVRAAPGGITTSGSRAQLMAILALVAAVVLLLAARNRTTGTHSVPAAVLMVFGMVWGFAARTGPGALAVLPELHVLVAAMAVLVLVATYSPEDPEWMQGTPWLLALGTAVLAVLRLWPEGEALLHAGTAMVQEGLLVAAGSTLLLAGRRRASRPAPLHGGWIENAGWITVLAAASHGLGVLLEHGHLAEMSRTVPLSVLWGVAGLVLVGYGLISRTPHRRHLGLALLAGTVAKVFLHDLAAAATMVRVLAFAVTGAALLAGSFLYIRFRALLGSEETGAEAEESPDAW